METQNTYPTTQPEESIFADEDMAEFVERWKAVNEKTMNQGDRLTELYAQGNHEAVESLLEELVDDIAVEDPEFQANMTTLKELRTHRNRDIAKISELMDRQKALMANFRRYIINETGLPDEVRFTQIEQARNDIHARLAAAFPDGYEPKQALSLLGMEVQEGDDVKYHFPEELLPDSTTDLWQTYLASVCNHRWKAKALARGESDDRAAVEQADRTRTYAHNAVTKELHSILSFPEDKWSRLDTRELLGRTRDFVLPNESAAFSEHSVHLVTTHTGQLEVVGALSARH